MTEHVAVNSRPRSPTTSDGRAPEGSVLGRALRSQRRDVVIASVLVTIHQVAEVLIPVTIGVVIDRAITPSDGEQALRWLLVLAVQFVVLSAAGCIALYYDERAKMGAVHQARIEVARRVLDRRGGFDRSLPGEIVSLSTVETTRIGEGVAAVILSIGAVTGILAGAAVLFATSFWLGLAVVVGLPIVLIVVQILATPLVSRADEHQEAVGVASGVAADLLAGLRVLKGLGAEAAGARRYRRASASALDAGLTANRFRSSYAGFTVTIASTFIILVAWIGGRQALDGAISVGALVAALGVTQFLVGPLGRLAYAGSQLAQARASAEHLDTALATPPGAGGGDTRLGDDVPGAVSVDAVSHGPLTEVSFAAPAGALVGIVAEPADAAALVALLDRSVDPDGGAIHLDRSSLADLDLDDARRVVVVAHHDAPLFAGTIRDNVLLAAPAGADIDRLVEATSLHDLVDGLADGLDAAVTEDGRSLSGGQRQRVALARALATDAPVLVLDEPTTAVDTATEHRIATQLRSVRAGRTTLVLTSSPTVLRETDHVVVLHDGRVVAEGRHEELAATDRRYRDRVLR